LLHFLDLGGANDLAGGDPALDLGLHFRAISRSLQCDHSASCRSFIAAWRV
jgi:hypothetical protein